MTKFKFLLFIAVLVGFAALAHAGLYEGTTAYIRHDFAKAYAELKPLAEQGNAKAQVFLAFMYDEGHGVTQDYA